MADESVLLGQLAEEFAARVRQGQMPAIEEYAARHPALAERVRALFPTLMLLEGMAAGGQAAADGSSTELRPGSVFGAYRIERPIGKGGMGVVYEAVHLALGRRVALKVLPVEGPRQATHLERFLREAQTAAGLHHTNIVPVFDVGQVNGTPYYAMQLIHGTGLDRAGQPLEPAVKPIAEPTAATISADGSRGQGVAPAPPVDRPLSPPGPGHYRWVAEVGVQAAEGLAYAHQRGVIHRDIKPSNLLLDEQGVVWITDFGLARRLEDVALTHTGALLGTPRYMSPEQAEAAKRPIDHRTDIYSLGATLYELLTRRPAFDGSTPYEIVMQVIERDPVRPRRLDPKVPADLETIVLKAMAKKPSDRYPTGEALADDLRRYLKLEPIQARRIGPLGRLVRWSRRHPTAAVLVAVCLLSGLGLLTLALGMWHNAELRAQAVQDLDDAENKLKEVNEDLNVARHEWRVARNEAAVQEKRAAEKRAEVERLEHIAQAAHARAAAAQEEGRHTRFASDMLMAHAAWQTDSVAGLIGLLEGHRPQAGCPDLRGFEWNYLWRLAHRELFTVAAHVTALKPQKDPADAAPFGGQENPVVLAVSPDGKTLASASLTEPIKLWDVATGTLRQTLAAPTGPVAALAFSPDGDAVLAITLKGVRKDFQISDLEALQDIWAGKVPPSIRPLTGLFAVQNLPSDGGKAAPPQALDPVAFKTPISIAALGRQGVEAVSGMALPGNRILVPMVMATSPDGKLFAVGGLAGTVPTLPAFKMERHVGGILLWDIAAGKEKVLLLGHSAPVAGLAFTPDSQTLASASFDTTVKLWDVAAARERTTLRGHAAPVLAVAYSGDGKRLASAAEDGIIKTWDPVAGQPELTCKGHGQEVLGLAWAADGHVLTSGSVDGLLKIWDLKAVQGPPVLKGYNSAVRALAFLPENGGLASVDHSGMLLVNDVITGATRIRHQLKAPFGLQRSIYCATFSPDGRSLAVGGGVVHPVELYDVVSGKKSHSLDCDKCWVYSLAFAPDGKTLAAGAGYFVQGSPGAGEIKLWDIGARKELFTLPGYRNKVTSLAFSRDGRILAGAAVDGTVKLWEVANGNEILSFRSNAEVKALAFSPDSRRLAVASGSIITLRDAVTGDIVVTMEGYSHEAASLAFSPDGRRLASGAGEGRLGRGGGVKLWDTATGLEVLTLSGPSDTISHVAFSPDGGRLAAAVMVGPSLGPDFLSQPSEIRIWDGRRLPER
jgi:WD40 repeat protein/serine/threonine protein kinase